MRNQSVNQKTVVYAFLALLLSSDEATQVSQNDAPALTWGGRQTMFYEVNFGKLGIAYFNRESNAGTHFELSALLYY